MNISLYILINGVFSNCNDVIITGSFALKMLKITYILDMLFFYVCALSEDDIINNANKNDTVPFKYHCKYKSNQLTVSFYNNLFHLLHSMLGCL